MNPDRRPAVVIHSLSDGQRALSAAAGAPGGVTLLSAADAGCFMGAGWWRALVAELAAGHPGRPFGELLDCGDAAGRAMEALRLGQRGLILAASCPQHGAVAERAAMLGAVLLAARPPCLDLGAAGAGRRLAAWLGVEPGPPPGPPIP